VADDNDNDDDNSKLSTRMKSGPSLWTWVLCMSQIYMRLQSLIVRSYLIYQWPWDDYNW
jgi:hypothetical protein